MDDKDSIRVDLLKFRRKAYLSYPPGSQERKNFLKTILQNELRFTEQDVPHDLINFLIDGNKMVFWGAIQKSLLWFIGTIFFALSILLFWTQMRYFSLLFLIPGAGCFNNGLTPLLDYWKYCKSLKVVKQYSSDMKKYMNRISNDIKRLDGPHL